MSAAEYNLVLRRLSWFVPTDTSDRFEVAEQCAEDIEELLLRYLPTGDSRKILTDAKLLH